ncbi:cysteine proteinase, partial [Polychaeton citri CBS 116435]
MSAEVQENVHFFNTYFYSSLLNQKSRGPIHYDKVKRWTRNVDLFNIPYVVIPFNLDLHWFVAIICNLPNIPRELGAIPPDKPVILTLDSFGSPHASEVRNIKAYLAAEAREKRGMFIDASGSKYIQGITAKGIPEQTNFCDCGVFLIEYIHRFAKNPKDFVEKAINRQMD